MSHPLPCLLTPISSVSISSSVSTFINVFFIYIDVDLEL